MPLKVSTLCLSTTSACALPNTNKLTERVKRYAAMATISAPMDATTVILMMGMAAHPVARLRLATVALMELTRSRLPASTREYPSVSTWPASRKKRA